MDITPLVTTALILIFVGLAVVFLRLILRLHVESSDSYWRDFAASENWEYSRLNPGAETIVVKNIQHPFSLEPVKNALIDFPWHRTLLVPAHVVTGQVDGHGVSLSDPFIVVKVPFMGGGRRFLYVAYSEGKYKQTAIIAPKKIPSVSFRLYLPGFNHSQTSENFQAQALGKYDLSKLLVILESTNVESVSVIVGPDGLYLLTPFRPDLKEFAGLTAAIARGLE